MSTKTPIVEVSGAARAREARRPGAAALESLFSPQSIAIVGLSEKGVVGRHVLHNLRAFGFAGDIVGVNPRGPVVDGIACHPTIAEAPAVQCAVIAVGGQAAVAVMGELAQVGVPAVVVLSAGFAESGADGADLETQIQTIADEHGMAVLGPNCLGYMNFARGVAPFGATVTARSSSVGITAVVQSGSVAIALAHPARELDLGLLVSIGNESVVDAALCIQHALDDPETRAVLLHLEGVRDGAAFSDALARARGAGVPVVVLKTGRSSAGQSASRSHTAALVTNDAVFDAVCEKYGVVRVDDVDQLVEVTKLLAARSEDDAAGASPRPNGLGVLTLSGGEAALFVDRVERTGLGFATLTEDTRAALQEVLPHFVAAANPLDGTGVVANDPAAFQKCLEALGRDPGVDQVVVLDDLVDRAAYAQPVALAAAGAARAVDVPVVWLSCFSRGTDDASAHILRESGVPILYGLEPGTRALDAAFGSRSKMPAAGPSSTEPAPGNVLAGAAAADLSRNSGIPFVRSHEVRSSAQAVRAFQEIGTHVAVKIADSSVAHKTEFDGIRLGLANADAVAAAVEELQGICVIHGLEPVYEVQEMVSGRELLVSVRRDLQFGHVVTLGLGGTLTELLGDVATTLLPIEEGEVDRLVDTLRGRAILDGYRGRQRVDRRAIESFIRAAGDAMQSRTDLLEAEFNPVIVLGDRAVAVDAVFTLESGAT